jgi:hypothetical protein
MTNHRPYVLVIPYLPLKKPVQFAGWTVGPVSAADGRWSDGAFEHRAKEFISKFRDAHRKALENPSLAFRTDSGVDGVLPKEREFDALQLAVTFSLLDANPEYQPDADGHWVSTADIGDVWAQPIDVANGYVALGRGLLVRVGSGGSKTSDATFEIPAPVELSIPLSARIDADLAEAIYRVAAGAHDSEDAALAGRITTAVRLHAKSWRNSVSFGYEDRVVMLRTAFEALTDTSKGPRARKVLEGIFNHLRKFGATTPDSTEHMLCRLDEKPNRAFTFTGKDGQPVTEQLTDLGHWFSVFGEARHKIVHEGIVPPLIYNEQGSAYNGPLFFVGERVLREAIRATLVRFGYVDLWEDAGFRGIGKLIEQAFARADLINILVTYARVKGSSGPTNM